MFDTGENGTMHNIEVTDISPEDDGIPWDPYKTAEAITQVPTDEVAFLSGDEVWGPENMVTFFLSVMDVDLRDLIDWKGDIDPKLLGRVRKEYRKTARKATSERKWRDIVGSK